MKSALFAVEVILGIIVIVSILLQKSKADALSGLVQGSNNETFFSKNKGNTRDVLLQKTTAISMLLFAINTVVLNII